MKKWSQFSRGLQNYIFINKSRENEKIMLADDELNGNIKKFENHPSVMKIKKNKIK